MKEVGKTSSLLVDVDLILLTDCVEEIRENYPKISSIAIGIPGSVDNGRIFYIPGYEHLQNFDLKGYLETRFSLPVVIENDMNAVVLGYHNSNGIMKDKSLVYIYSGHNGPVAGIMVNGVVVRGITFSGEVSFIPQYDEQNFGQALQNENRKRKAFIGEDYEIDTISRFSFYNNRWGNGHFQSNDVRTRLPLKLRKLSEYDQCSDTHVFEITKAVRIRPMFGHACL